VKPPRSDKKPGITAPEPAFDRNKDFFYIQQMPLKTRSGKGDHMKKLAAILILLPLLFIPEKLFVQETHLDVPYVPTKPEVVTEMLRMAHVGKDDILYDLGCGDGRIVITAAQLYGTRGVGIDIDPERIKESQENAAKANVTHLVKFINQDLFEADFHEATVVSLYLLTSVNLRLRPRLLAQLRPGTRVVSHNYAMDTWKPDQSSVVMVNGQTHNVYFWVIPANVSGTWEWTWTENMQKVPYVLELEQRFQWPVGKIKVKGAELPLGDVVLTGDKIKFSVDKVEDGKTVTMVFQGRVAGNTIEGSMEKQGGANKQNKTVWKAKRNPASMKAIDSET
jgi:precorrin-6B methylase 2